MGGSLTVSERILYHLQSFTKYEDKYEVPFHLTQDGISQSCAISRAHAAIELKKLKASGMVEERLSHVRRGKTRRKVYLLTHDGKARAAAIQQYVKDNEIDTLVDSTKVSSDASPVRGRRACRSSPLPSLKYFFGRERELNSLEQAFQDPHRRLLVVRGIPGIGKTTLVVKALSESSGQRIFWYAVKPWDLPKNVADSLGAFFAENGSKRLEAYLASGAFELGEISYLLRETLTENGYIFAFDDADASEAIQEFLRMFRHSGGAGKMIVTMETGASFYDQSEVVAKGEVAEFELGGLETAAAMELLKARGIGDRMGRSLVSMVNGHPLSLEMVTESTPKEAKHQLSRFFEERFYDGLPAEQKSLLQFASVFQVPFPAEAIPRGLRGVRRGSMLREVVPGKFEIHASIRAFVYGHMAPEERRRWHSVAADYYLRSADSHERLLHLLKANRGLEAEMLMARLGEELLDGCNVMSLWQLLEGYEPSRHRYRAGVMLTQSRLASLVGDFDAAWRILERVSQEEVDGLRAEALIEMGMILSGRGELKEASRLLTDALSQTEDAPQLRAKALRGLGVVEFKMGDHAKAEDLLGRSAQDSLSVMDRKGMLKAHLELGNVLIGLGEHEKAIEHLSKCAAGFGPVDLASAYAKMGDACVHLERVDDARSYLENAVRLSADTGQPRMRANALMSLADVLVKSGDAHSASERCFEALEVFTELDDPLGVSSAYASLGAIERLSGNLDMSEEYHIESVKALEGTDAPRALAQKKVELGVFLAERGERERAVEMLKESMVLSKSISAGDIASMADAELRRITGSEGH
jgi:tetratricopeptide (TPR) repeat protein